MKKIIAAVLFVLMIISTALPVFAEYDIWLEQAFIYDETFTLGDVNGDGTTNSVDSLTLKYYIAGISNDNIILDASDFDADGKLGTTDSYCLKTVIAGAQPVSAYENGKHIYKFTIAGNDISSYSFVLPEGTTDDDNSYVAYRLLFKYIRYLTGVELPVSYGTAETSNAIYIHMLSIDDEYGSKLGTDGMKYEVVNGDLNIYGTNRGTMYAAYEIIEKHLGVRFLSDSQTFVYKSRVSDIPEGTSVEIIPKLTYRYAAQTYDGYGAMNHYFAHKHNGYHIYSYTERRYGGLTGDLYGSAHSVGYYWQMGTGVMPPEGALNDDGNVMNLGERYQAKMASGQHKEEYSWQPCASDNSQFEILYNGMLDCNRMIMSWGRELYIEEGFTLFSFSINDNQNYCQCTPCKNFAKGKNDNPFIPGDDSTPAEGYSGLYINLYNKAAVRVQEDYPGVRIYGIIYAKDIPKTVLPDKNLVIQYCGINCHNHIFGMEECYEKGNLANGLNNADDMTSLRYWSDACKQTGAELWFWIYPVNYHYLLIDTPNIPNLYYNTKYLIDEYNVTGIAYEGNYDGDGYCFESLKAYMVSRLMWDTDMTYEEWVDTMKEFLYMYYGDGYELIYQYINMMTEAGDQCGICFINNFDRPGDMFSYEYLGSNYAVMRGLLEEALAMTDRDDQISRIETLMVSCDFMALSALHTDWYVNGNNVELYEERYTWMYDKMVEYDMTVFSSPLYNVPATCDFTVNPMTQIYQFGSRRPEVYP